jgi:hypothetical protein
MGSYSWEVVCITRDEESEYDDCRSIDELGYVVAANRRFIDAETACLRIQSGNKRFHVEVDGEELPLEAAGEYPQHYVRTRQEDSPEDPLLSLPSREELEHEDYLESIGG